MYALKQKFTQVLDNNNNDNANDIMTYNNTTCNIIVFDLDETLGQFSQLGYIIHALEFCTKQNITEKQTFQILDIYSNFIRPQMLKILEYIKQKKIEINSKSLSKTTPTLKVIIFTNNQGPKAWAEQLSRYFNQKMNYTLFDDVIGAFKVQDTIQDPRRTSNSKRHMDIMRIMECSSRSQILFFDDVYHPEMNVPNVTYIHLDPYTYQYKPQEIIELYVRKFGHTIRNKLLFQSCMGQILKGYKTSKRVKHSILPEDYRESKRIYTETTRFINTHFSFSPRINSHLHGGNTIENTQKEMPVTLLKKLPRVSPRHGTKKRTKQTDRKHTNNKTHKTHKTQKTHKTHKTHKNKLKQILRRIHMHKRDFTGYLTRKRRKSRTKSNTRRRKHSA